MDDKKTVEIDITVLAELQERNEWLSHLESAGLNDWEGYEYAVETWKEETE